MLITLIGMTLAFAEPSSQPSTSGPSIPAEEFDGIVRMWLENTLLDFDSAKIKIATPPQAASFKKGALSRVQGDVACYDINAKNAFGGYAGNDRTLVVVREGKVVYHTSELYPDGFTAFDVIGKVCGDSGRPQRGYFDTREPGQTTRN